MTRLISKVFLAAILLSSSSAFACVDFSGEYNSPSHESYATDSSVYFKQEGCEKITYSLRNILTGRWESDIDLIIDGPAAKWGIGTIKATFKNDTLVLTRDDGLVSTFSFQVLNRYKMGSGELYKAKFLVEDIFNPHGESGSVNYTRR